MNKAITCLLPFGCVLLCSTSVYSQNSLLDAASWLVNSFSNVANEAADYDSSDDEYSFTAAASESLKSAWDFVDDVISLDIPDISPVRWKDVFHAGAKVGQAIADSVDYEAFQRLVPDLSTYGFDSNYVRSHLNSWNWEKFTDDLMKAKPEEDLDEPDQSYSKGIDDLADMIHSYTTFEASEEDKAELPPECFMTVPQMVRYAGFPCSIYTVVTKDGYRLTMHRIPFGRTTAPSLNKSSTFEDARLRRGRRYRRGRARRPVVFLQHGILSDSSCWTANGANRSLAFILADAGFDVWLGNIRGNTYSRGHVELNPDTDERYWRFTWQQMSEYDLPAMVDAVLRVTKQPNLYYIAHSQGTMIAFARLAEDADFNRKIKMIFGLAPVSTLGHINSPIKWFSALTGVAHFGVSVFGGAEVLPSTSLSKWITAKLKKMSQEDPLAYHGHNLLLFLVGFNVKHYHNDRLPVFLAQTPSGTSLHNFIHMSQLVESGKMRKWDYWSENENMREYGQVTPPEYDVSRIRTPIVLFLGSKDDLADPKDGRLLALNLKKSLVHFRMIKDWDHLDFIWGKAAPSILYPDIVDFINRAESGKEPASSTHETGFRHVRGVDDEL